MKKCRFQCTLPLESVSKSREEDGALKNRKILIKRIVTGILLFFFLLLIAADLRMEIGGVPEHGIRMIRRFCAARGYHFHVRTLHAGLVMGIRASGFRLDGGLGEPSIRAESIRAEFSLWKLLRGILIPFDIAVRDASVRFPLFPEYGEEGKYDTLTVTELDADLTGIPGELQLKRASGMLGEFRFQADGTFDNLLHYSGAKGLDALRTMIFPQRDRAKKPSFSVYHGFIRSVPMSIRKRILYTTRRMALKSFQKKPECVFSFHLDPTSFSSSTAEAVISLPSFRYGYLHLNRFEERLSLKDGKFSIDKLRIQFRNGGFAEAEGKYDSEGRTARGTVRGECHAEDILRFFDESFQDEIKTRIQFGKERIRFHGTIENFSLSGRFLGKMDLLLPNLRIGNAVLSNADISLSADSNVLTGIIHSAEINGKAGITGKIRFENGMFRAELHGKIPQTEIVPVLPHGIAESTKGSLRFNADGDGVKFTGELTGKLRDIRSTQGRFQIETGGFSIREIPIRTLTASLHFSAEEFRIVSMTAETGDGTRITGGLSCRTDDRRVSAELVCSGTPYRLLDALGGSHREFLRSLTRGIVWPKSRDSVEVSASVYASYGKEPFFRVSGAVAARDFSYEKIPFRYGAARFIVDADSHLILPDAILETKDGKMYITAEYTPGPDEMKSPDPTGKLNFFLKSTLSGNDMIRSLYPVWKSEYIDFPESVSVESRGVIDYAKPEKTHFTASVTNGTCIWRKMRIDDIDTTLSCRDNILSFYNAGGTFAEGRLLMDYTYDFSKETGTAAIRLSGANLKSLLENLGQKDIEPEYRNGIFNANLAARLSYSEKDELLLNGDGGFTLTGTNLWTVPIFGSLLRVIGKVWSLESFGAITKADGKFTLDGDRLILRKFRSDGGFVSLNANGFYRWQDNFFDINVRAELLRNALPFDAMSHLLTPVSWILEQKLKGNFNTYQWEQQKK